MSPRTHAPVLAILLQGAVACLIALTGTYGQILSYVVSVDFIWFALTGAALLVFRAPRPRAGRLPGARPSGHDLVLHPRLRDHRDRHRRRSSANSAIGFAILAAGVPVCLCSGSRAEGGLMRAMQSDYMYWAKTQAPVRYALGSSRSAAFPSRSLSDRRRRARARWRQPLPLSAAARGDRAQARCRRPSGWSWRTARRWRTCWRCRR